MKRIHILLPPKEKFSPAGAGAFALIAYEVALASRNRDGTTVFGTAVDQPFKGVHFQELKPSLAWLVGNNIGMARAYVNAARNDRPELVEVMNRPAMAYYVARKLDVPVAVYLGNDPRNMDGAKTVHERTRLAKTLAAIYCVSDYIRRCYIEGLEAADAAKVHVLHLGIKRAGDFPEGKDPAIVYVGRVVPEKGVLELTQALARVLPKHLRWHAHIVGASWFGTTREVTEYEQAVIAAAGQCERLHFLGFRPHNEVMELLRRAAVAIVPSVWNEPFPRSAVEALAQGCALVASKRGGLPEIGTERALFLREISAEAISEALEWIITHDAERARLQERAWRDFPFGLEEAVARWDALRDRITA